MAPEQIQGKLHLASDQYALGVVVYKVASGVLPFDGKNSIEIAMHHLYDPPPPLRERLPNIPINVANTVYEGTGQGAAAAFCHCSGIC